MLNLLKRQQTPQHIYQEVCISKNLKKHLSPLPTNPPCQLDVLGHDSDPLGVDGTEVGVLEETHQVGLASLLQSHHSRALEPQVGLEVLSNLPNKALER